MVKQHHHSQQLESIREFDASAFCTDVGVFLGLAEVHSDRVHSASGSKFEATENVGDLWVSLFHVRNLLRCLVRVFHRDG